MRVTCVHHMRVTQEKVVHWVALPEGADLSTMPLPFYRTAEDERCGSDEQRAFLNGTKLQRCEIKGTNGVLIDGMSSVDEGDDGVKVQCVTYLPTGECGLQIAD